MKNEFQYRLQKALSEKGINASELSALSGVGKSDISNYINGKYTAKQDKCYALAVALGVDPGWLMTGEEPVSRRTLDGEQEQKYSDGEETKEVRIISSGVSKMPEEAQKRLLNIIRLTFEEYKDYFNDEGSPNNET